MNPEHLLTATLRELPHGAAVTRILAAAIAAVEPGAAVRRFLRREGETLVAGDVHTTSAHLIESGSLAPARQGRQWQSLPPGSSVNA